MNTVKNILVLCTGNSCRSQMAEGYLRKYAGAKANIYSAGIEAHGLNPIALQVMMEDGIDISGQASKTVDELYDIQFDYVITVCDNAKENCPYYPAAVKLIHKDFPDPAKFEGNENNTLAEFRRVRNMIAGFTVEFVKNELNDL